jgi:hypothetical protein
MGFRQELLKDGGSRETRTLTRLLSIDFESIVYTNSTMLPSL